jgi:hypothetical protein
MVTQKPKQYLDAMIMFMCVVYFREQVKRPETIVFATNSSNLIY